MEGAPGCHILQEGLLHDLRVGEQEDGLPLLQSAEPEDALQVLPPLLRAVPLQDPRRAAAPITPPATNPFASLPLSSSSPFCRDVWASAAAHSPPARFGTRR